MTLQARISAAKLQAKVGSTRRILIDEVDDGVAIGRSTADAPEIDGKVYVEQGRGLRPGEFADVRIIAADAHDLQAELLID